MAHRNISNQSIIRDAKTKIYRLPQNPTSMAGSTPNENKILLLASGNWRICFFFSLINIS